MDSYLQDSGYYEELKERAIIARQSKKKRHIPRAPRFNNYTQRQLKALSGEVHTLIMSEPVASEEFLAMSVYTQKEYLNHILYNYGIDCKHYCSLTGIPMDTIKRLGVMDREYDKPNVNSEWLNKLRLKVGIEQNKDVCTASYELVRYVADRFGNSITIERYA